MKKKTYKQLYSAFEELTKLHQQLQTTHAKCIQHILELERGTQSQTLKLDLVSSQLQAKINILQAIKAAYLREIGAASELDEILSNIP